MGKEMTKREEGRTEGQRIEGGRRNEEGRRERGSRTTTK